MGHPRPETPIVAEYLALAPLARVPGLLIRRLPRRLRFLVPRALRSHGKRRRPGTVAGLRTSSTTKRSGGRGPGGPGGASRPARKPSSSSTVNPATVPPARSTRSRVASAVPPVASTSSTTRTRWPARTRPRAPRASPSRTPGRTRPRASLAGSLPALRTGTTPTPVAYATAAASRNPRASMPATTSNPAAVVRDDRVDDLAEGGAVGEQRAQVLEDDAGLRKVRHVDDVARHDLRDVAARCRRVPSGYRLRPLLRRAARLAATAGLGPGARPLARRRAGARSRCRTP